ncbi:hypothetical protein RUM44_007703 [Polyplax serrata]|uniref:Alpha-1,3-glucosyltransferase n=1 Tax=Polyplax serrata TaxID=468196 RepID=A0ABR1BAA0_POLSC
MTYHSTDFEVHRNWLAITHNLPLSKWYHENTSEWTLDYPPLFAWFEFLLSHFAKFFDEKMLIVQNLNYASPNTILFQRLSVIVTDLVFAYGIKECCTYLSNSGVRKSSKWSSKWRSPATILQVLLFGNVGLIIVDHVHFQYNGFLFGILLISISKLFQSKCLQSAIYFTILLNLKHIFIYVAPPFFVYLLRNYCFEHVTPGLCISWSSFSRKRFLKLSSVVLFIFALSFGPFLLLNQISQVFLRLFPFKRGLCHAYWAPNFWALYNTLDKVLAVSFQKLGFSVVTNSTMTKGLVQDIDHAVFPNVPPKVTFILTLVTILPCLVKLWRWPGNPLHFIRCLVICALSSFLFGWHVHEKAILIAIIPLSLVAVIWQKEAQVFVVLSVTGHYSLHPLLFTRFEIPLKFSLFLLHCFYSFSNLSYLFDERHRSSLKLPLLNRLESLYVLGFIPLFLSEVLFFPAVGLTTRLPFLSLLLTSAYCSLGVCYSWVKYYWHFLTMKMDFKSYESDNSIIEVEVPKKPGPPIIEIVEDDIELNIKVDPPPFSTKSSPTKAPPLPDIMIVSEHLANTVDISPDHWTSDMKRFYNEDCGDEDFSVEELQSKMDRKPHLWKISQKDYLYNGKGRYINCRRCNQPGHNASDCTEPSFGNKCHMCALSGHTINNCPKAVCLNCGNQTKKYDICCFKCRKQNGLTCMRCGMKGHLWVECPDHWRLFHLTTKSTQIVVPSVSVNKDPEYLWCCNCSQRGHLSFYCKIQNNFTIFPETLPYIVSYNMDFLDINQDLNSEDLTIKRRILKRMQKQSRRKSRALCFHESRKPIKKAKQKKKKKKWRKWKNQKDIQDLLR